jgi:histone H3/H4
VLVGGYSIYIRHITHKKGNRTKKKEQEGNYIPDPSFSLQIYLTMTRTKNSKPSKQGVVRVQMSNKAITSDHQKIKTKTKTSTKTTTKTKKKRTTTPQKRRCVSSKVRIQREIRKYSKSTDFLIPRAPFQRLVRQLMSEYKSDVRISKDALFALQAASEKLLAQGFQGAALLAETFKFQTVQTKHFRLGFAMAPTMNSSSLLCNSTQASNRKRVKHNRVPPTTVVVPTVVAHSPPTPTQDVNNIEQTIPQTTNTTVTETSIPGTNVCPTLPNPGNSD